ncbi:hypothetical protein EG850_11210 [Gulosibacter macacae]|uniref:IrrE N-terminal-like domain-containing protein n=1 Tax=Gulosibacter macacae TaxID=2488791 RepID=A0A3P3VUE5_9MICO|nr:hypothetical protein [Gulosibacter macacae]RRJ85947.1 hypothetical protein EG850_11210 [Gulosibacter macacae]
MFDPHAYVALNDIDVEYRHDLPDDGRYYPGSDRILIRTGLTPIEERSVLTHELGHRHYGHYCSSPRAELLADRWAARRLIDPAELERVARLYPDNPGAWCLHLQVSPRLLEVHLAQQQVARPPIARRA